MSERLYNPRAIDLSVFCRQEASVSGAWALTELPRLAEGFSAVPDGEAAWSAEGSLLQAAGGAPQLWLQVDASATVPLQCQRCLQTLIQPLQVHRRIRFVRTEEEAARLDEASDDDVLVQPPRLDLRELLEDELILALPLVPRHSVCPEPLPAQNDAAAEDAAPPHPFAALAALRRKQ